jgi:hypothetical protein
MDTLLGRIGLRGEALLTWTDAWPGVSVPITLAVVWRLP